MLNGFVSRVAMYTACSALAPGSAPEALHTTVELLAVRLTVLTIVLKEITPNNLRMILMKMKITNLQSVDKEFDYFAKQVLEVVNLTNPPRLQGLFYVKVFDVDVNI